MYAKWFFYGTTSWIFYIATIIFSDSKLFVNIKSAIGFEMLLILLNFILFALFFGIKNYHYRNNISSSLMMIFMNIFLQYCFVFIFSCVFGFECI